MRRKRTQREQPEDLSDRVSGKSLGIDERDLLIASTAVQYGPVLVTNDSNDGMKRINKAAQTLELAGKEVLFRNRTLALISLAASQLNSSRSSLFLGR